MRLEKRNHLGMKMLSLQQADKQYPHKVVSNKNAITVKQ